MQRNPDEIGIKSPGDFWRNEPRSGWDALVFSDLDEDESIDSSEILQRLHYYPFGLRQKGSWTFEQTSNISYQYNGIEYLDQFGLDLNLADFRALDPAVGRWWSVDPASEAVAGMSPYQALGNSPILNADPEGDLPFLAVLGIGVASGIFSNGLSNISNGQSFFSGVGKAAIFGAVGAASSFGIGSVFGGVGSFGDELLRGGVHALSSGLQSELSGGSFLHGALAGGLSSGIGLGVDAVGGNASHQILGGGVGGGIGAAIAGGNFFNGFGQGLLIGSFNHAFHNLFAETDPLKKHIDEAISLEEWTELYSGKTRDEIISEIETRGNFNSQKGGPKHRYVIDPKTGNVIDMRHFLIVGKHGKIVGNLFEEAQYRRGYSSGRDPQDYFSNDLGYKFYRTNSQPIIGNMGPFVIGNRYNYAGGFVNSIYNFLKNR